MEMRGQTFMLLYFTHSFSEPSYVVLIKGVRKYEYESQNVTLFVELYDYDEKKCSAYYFHFLFYIALLDDAGMGDGKRWIFFKNKNQAQHDNALHILNTRCTDTQPLENHWANELLYILTNGKTDR